jgi:hypothetical protein
MNGWHVPQYSPLHRIFLQRAPAPLLSDLNAEELTVLHCELHLLRDDRAGKLLQMHLLYTTLLRTSNTPVLNGHPWPPTAGFATSHSHQLYMYMVHVGESRVVVGKKGVQQGPDLHSDGACAGLSMT